MSMLTPLAPSRGRWWRRLLRRFVAVVLAFGLLGGAGYAAWHYLVREQPVTAAPTPDCTPGPAVTPAPPPAPLAAAKIRLNVYNATARTGLARNVAAQYKARGFRTAAVANDPRKRRVAVAAEVRSGPRGAGGARTVAAHVNGRVAFLTDNRADGSVDVALGAQFRALRTPAAALQVLRAKPKPVVPRKPAGC